jgi:hypothetical protein
LPKLLPFTVIVGVAGNGKPLIEIEEITRVTFVVAGPATAWGTPMTAEAVTAAPIATATAFQRRQSIPALNFILLSLTYLLSH